MTALPALRRERLRLFGRILAVSGVGGILVGLRMGSSGELFLNVALGAINAMQIAGCLAGIEIFLLREGSAVQRLLRLMPFALVALAKTLVYGAIAGLVILANARVTYVLLGGTVSRPLDTRTELILVGLSLATMLVFIIVLQAASLVGRRTFRDLLLGRYRRPRAERRFFLFVDVMGSTTIAERLGPLQAHNFLAAVFSATAEPIAAMHGEIYQYVGDEIVVTWTEAEGRVEARPLRCLFLMEEALRERAAYFHAQFAAEPGLRAALHLGEVIAGEVGELRRAIVFHGDVMNTASRLENATREVGARFIASGDALDALGSPSALAVVAACRDLGELALRGRKEPIRAYGLERIARPG